MANKLQAGYASVNITPPFGIPLAGYFLERPMDGVLDELEVCALALSDGELFLEIIKGIELMHSIEFLIILSVTALDLTVVSWCERSDQLMPDPQLLQCAFK